VASRWRRRTINQIKGADRAEVSGCYLNTAAGKERQATSRTPLRSQPALSTLAGRSERPVSSALPHTLLAASYGSDVNLPIPIEEQNKPNSHGCLDRNP
jgi:hypothetical protein